MAWRWTGKAAACLLGCALRLINWGFVRLETRVQKQSLRRRWMDGMQMRERAATLRTLHACMHGSVLQCTGEIVEEGERTDAT